MHGLTVQWYCSISDRMQFVILYATIISSVFYTAKALLPSCALFCVICMLALLGLFFTGNRAVSLTLSSLHHHQSPYFTDHPPLNICSLWLIDYCYGQFSFCYVRDLLSSGCYCILSKCGETRNKLTGHSVFDKKAVHTSCHLPLSHSIPSIILYTFVPLPEPFPSLPPSFPLFMTMLVLTTVFLLLISGAHSFQSGRQRAISYPSISPSLSSGIL